jgi:hypothetical protein
MPPSDAKCPVLTVTQRRAPLRGVFTAVMTVLLGTAAVSCRPPEPPTAPEPDDLPDPQASSAWSSSAQRGFGEPRPTRAAPIRSSSIPTK